MILLLWLACVVICLLSWKYFIFNLIIIILSNNHVITLTASDNVVEMYFILIIILLMSDHQARRCNPHMMWLLTIVKYYKFLQTIVKYYILCNVITKLTNWTLNILHNLINLSLKTNECLHAFQEYVLIILPIRLSVMITINWIKLDFL